MDIDNMDILELVSEIRNDYRQNRFVFIEGSKMKKILSYFGAEDEDIYELEHSGDSLKDDPTLPFRKSSNGRFLIDFQNDKISRLCDQPFVLSEKEGFKRGDAGQLRNFRPISNDLQQNSAFQALLKFQANIFHGIELENCKDLQIDIDKWVSTVFQLRTITTPELLGEPAKEGVHNDGVENVMTTLLYTNNMAPDSAVTQIHLMNEKTGTRWDSVNPEWIKGRAQHKNFLDTLLVIDTERKHSVSPVNALNPKEEAVRDIILLCTRHPKSKEHESYTYDSLEYHKEIPVSFPIFENKK